MLIFLHLLATGVFVWTYLAERRKAKPSVWFMALMVVATITSVTLFVTELVLLATP